jgi:hypothetical protein
VSALATLHSYASIQTVASRILSLGEKFSAVAGELHDCKNPQRRRELLLEMGFIIEQPDRIINTQSPLRDKTANTLTRPGM